MLSFIDSIASFIWRRLLRHFTSHAIRARFHFEMFASTRWMLLLAALVFPVSSSIGQEKTPAYPLAVAVDAQRVFTVDLDLPGVWQSESTTKLFNAGSNLLRHPMNRPRCVAIHPKAGILVGDSATREIYHIADASSDPKALTDGHVGIPMALAVSRDGKTIYVGDAEKRATFKLPIDGGSPELVARVNARGLALDEDGNLWAVTPDDAAVVKIDIENGEVENVIVGRPYQYPNGLVWAGDHGFVTDGYGKTIWKFTADGKTQVWHQGDPLVGPVGIALTADSLFVADPKQKHVYEFDLKSKAHKTRL
jgi:sugar lactone lactonase YvrE